MNNPTARTFILVASIVIILLFMHLLPTITVAGTEMRPVNILSDVIPEVGEKSAEEKPAEKPQSMLAKLKAEEKAEENPDGLTDEEVAEQQRRASRPVPKGLTPIVDYGNNAPGGMESFYKALRNRNSMHRPVRIAYYGDSFIESDILTCELRELLQAKLGGSGAGWIDCGRTTNSGRPTIKVQTSGFTSHSVMERKSFTSALQGLSQRYFTLSGPASLTLTGTTWKAHNANWSRAALYFKTNGGLTIKGMPNGQGGETFQPQASDEVQMASVSAQMNSVKWSITGGGSGDNFYCAVVEGLKGVTVDNLAMRGCSGLTLANIPEATLKSFAKARPYDLIVIQFGLNAAGPSSTDKSCNHYKGQMAKMIQLFKRCFPGTSILVVGVPDRGQRAAGGVQTMKGIELLLSYQQKLAQEEKVGFFSMFDAMGGRGSMGTFVKNGWAGKDYTHINMKGGNFLGKKLYDAIIFGADL
ncbi:MAG: hypothetical protein K5893_07245 [Prevotella sp.]|nr:hypothetical protein [Prevotella sp.]